MINVESVENMTFNHEHSYESQNNEPLADTTKSGLVHEVSSSIFDQLVENESQM